MRWIALQVVCYIMMNTKIEDKITKRSSHKFLYSSPGYMKRLDASKDSYTCKSLRDIGNHNPQMDIPVKAPIHNAQSRVLIKLHD